MLANRYVIVIFSIHGQFIAIQKLDYGGMLCKGYIFINSNLLSCKNWKQNQKFVTQLSYYCFE